MTHSPIDTRKAALDLMNITRRAWHIRARGAKFDLLDEGAGEPRDGSFAWPVGDPRFANHIDDRLEQFLREQE